MKYLAAILALVVWGIITIVLALSILGILPLLFMFEHSDENEGKGWFSIPSNLMSIFK